MVRSLLDECYFLFFHTKIEVGLEIDLIDIYFEVSCSMVGRQISTRMRALVPRLGRKRFHLLMFVLKFSRLTTCVGVLPPKGFFIVVRWVLRPYGMVLLVTSTWPLSCKWLIVEKSTVELCYVIYYYNV